MNEELIVIKKAIVHILDSAVGMPVVSGRELEFGSDLYDFFKKHISRIADSDEVKYCEFFKDSDFLEILKEGELTGFVSMSQRIAEKLYRIMNSNIEIPSADLVILHFFDGEEECLGILKMNYHSSYTHFTEESGNDIIVQKALLPSGNQMLKEAAIIGMHSKKILLVEKKYEINGVKTNYMSELFLQCRAPMSQKTKLELVSRAVEQVNKKYYEEDVNRRMEVKAVIYNELEGENGLQIETVKRKLFGDSEQMKKEFEEKIEKYNLSDTKIRPQNQKTVKKFENQYLTTDTGIEIKIPMEEYEDKEKVQFITNPDGTISLLIKNIGKITSK
jgi:hypothetical protein